MEIVTSSECSSCTGDGERLLTCSQQSSSVNGTKAEHSPAVESKTEMVYIYRIKGKRRSTRENLNDILRIREDERKQSLRSEMVEHQLVIFLLVLYKHTSDDCPPQSHREGTRAVAKKKAQTLPCHVTRSLRLTSPACLKILLSIVTCARKRSASCTIDVDRGVPLCNSCVQGARLWRLLADNLFE